MVREQKRPFRRRTKLRSSGDQNINCISEHLPTRFLSLKAELWPLTPAFQHRAAIASKEGPSFASMLKVKGQWRGNISPRSPPLNIYQVSKPKRLCKPHRNTDRRVPNAMHVWAEINIDRPLCQKPPV